MKKMLKRKKGISHVEMILSFVIFIGFLIFIMAIFRPFSIGKKESYINSIEKGILEHVSVNVTLATIMVSNVPSGSTCFSFGSELNPVIVKNKDGIFVKANSDRTTNIIKIQGGNNFYYILSSEKFIEDGFSLPPGTTCADIDITSYSLGLTREYKMLSYQKIDEMENKYLSDYKGLARELGIPASRAFSFSVRDSNEVVIFNSGEPKGKFMVTAKDIGVQIIHENANYGIQAGNIIFAKLNIRVW